MTTTRANQRPLNWNVNPDHDIAIELRDSGRTTTYVVHCLPPDFPEIVVLTIAEDVSEGLLFMAPQYTIAGGAWLSYLAIVDNNGVPRFHLTGHKGSWDFRPVRHPITVIGQEVRYLHGRTLFSKDLHVIEAEVPWSMHNNIHDFLITEAGTFVGINQEPVNRDFSDFNDSHGNPYSENEPVHDSAIREFTMAGSVELVWRSWTHRNTLKLSDCQQGNFPSRYAFINSIQFFDDGIVASSRGCNQVIRFERSGAVLSKTTWKFGGSDPGSESEAEFLEIVNDPAGSTAAQTITVVVHNDELDEPVEQFTVTLSNPVHAVLAGGGATVSATGTIADDDALPVLSIEDSSLTEGSGDGSMRFTVRLEPASARTVTVDYATSDGTATASVDYTPVTGTLTFGAGSTTRTIAVPIADDQSGEDTETFTVTLSSPSSAETGHRTGNRHDCR